MTGSRRGGRPSGSYTQAVRLLRMRDFILGLHWGATIAELAHEFDVTERQVRRDLAALEAAGVALEAVPTPAGATRIRIREGSAHTLTPRERFTLGAARRVLQSLAGTPLDEDGGTICAKLRVARGSGSRFVFVPDAHVDRYRGHRAILHTLILALMSNAAVSFRYRVERRAVRAGRLVPIALVLWRARLLVVGRRPAEGDVVLLTLDDVEQVELDDTPGAAPSERVDVLPLLDRARGLTTRDVRRAAALARAMRRAFDRGTH